MTIATLMPTCITPWSAGAWFESHPYDSHVHHSSASTMSACRMPNALCVSAMRRLTWVNAKT